jgi:hypothetical protein
MHYLVIDNRFASPVYAFLDQHPGSDRGFPGLAVHSVNLDTAPEKSYGARTATGYAIGQDPRSPSDYRQFGSEGAVRAAGFGLIEPRYVGVSWGSYARMFPFGAKTTKRY